MGEKQVAAIVDELQMASEELEGTRFETPPTPTERRAVSKLVDDATVVGLGEVGHGISEMFNLRARICRVLVEENGVRHIALEADITGARAIDAYATKGEGTAQEALASPGVYPFWQNQVMIEFLEWARSFNEGRSPRDQVRFHGIDIYEGSPTANSLRSYLQTVDEPLLHQVGDPLKTVARCGFITEPQTTLEEATVIADACEHVVAALKPALESNRDSYVATASEEAFQRAQHQTEVLATLKEMVNAIADGDPTTVDPMRDQAMTDNALRLLDEESVDPLLVLAHNVHVTRQAAMTPYESPTMLGERLDQRLGDGYRAIGASVGTGSTRVMDTETGGFETVDVPDTPEDSLPRVFSRLDGRFSLTNFGAVPDDGAAAQWLDGGPMHRPVPSKADVETSNVESDLRSWFDGFLFSSEAHPADVFAVK